MPAAIPGIERWPYPKGSWDGHGECRRGRWVTFGDVYLATGFLDLDAWPPKPVADYSEYAASFDVLPDGRFVVCSTPTKSDIGYAVRIHPPDWPADPGAGPPDVYPLPGGIRLAGVWAVSGRVVVFGSSIRRSDPPDSRRAYLLDRKKFVPAPGLPAVTSFGRGHFDNQVHANGKVTLATGEDVLVWDGDGYEWTGKKFERRWELGARTNYLDWTSVAWGDDGFFYLSNRRVMHARRGKRPARVHPDADNVMELHPGPDDSVILCEGRNPKSHVARVWFPAEGAYIPILRGHLRCGSYSGSVSIYWSAATRHCHSGPLTTFPDSGLLALKRVKPRGKGYQVARA